MSVQDDILYHQNQLEKLKQQAAAEAALAGERRAQASPAGDGGGAPPRVDYGRRIDWRKLRDEGGPEAVQKALAEMWASGPDPRYMSGGDSARGGKMPGKIERYMNP